MTEATAVVGGNAASSDSAGPQSFEGFNICEPLQESLREMGYEKPTDVQSAVIVPALSGADLVVQARTGSGKTTAFGIPIVERLDAATAESGKPRALILTPTRELSLQVATELRTLGSKKGVKILAVYGGVPLGRQVAGLKAGAHVVVGTPGRLLDHIRRGNLSLEQLQIVVLDEADEMLSMGFWDDVTELLRLAAAERQTMLFSATLPYQVARAAAQFLKEPVRVDVSGDELTVEGIENCIFHVLSDVPKPRQLLYLLEAEQPESSIIFCNTRNETEMIAKYLTQSGFIAEAITGNFRQKERERVMQRIKAGELKYMVATDVAARGIDIADLSHVINYSLPEFSEVYLHRVGRTGRVGKTGVALSLVDGKGLGTLSCLEREFGITFIEKKLPTEDDVLRQRSERIMKELSERAAVAEVGQHVAVAKEILESSDGAQVVAYLLKSYFGQQANEASRRKPQRAESNTPDDGAETNNRRSRRRRGRRRRRRSDNNDNYQDSTPDGLMLANNGSEAASRAAGEGAEGTEAPADGLARLRVNIGFDDGFKGRGAVAKKIAALAGLNDGIVTEVESRREYAVLKATAEIAELVIERVDGAQLGKKVITVSMAS